MSNKSKLKVFSFYMCFIFLVLLGAQYILLDLYSSQYTCAFCNYPFWA